MSGQPQGAVEALIERASADAELRDRLLGNARATIEVETGMTVPRDWSIVARYANGTIEIGFVDDELPDSYLDLITGGSFCAHEETHARGVGIEGARVS